MFDEEKILHPSARTAVAIPHNIFSDDYCRPTYTRERANVPACRLPVHVARFFISLEKVGFCSVTPVDNKISLCFHQEFPYRIVFSSVLDSESADTKAETLYNGQKCRDIKNLAMSRMDTTIWNSSE